jgi:hypothetical protein
MQLMAFTLKLGDTLAEELQRQASEEHMSVEKFAYRLMRDALKERIAAESWRSQNRRRLELIAKKLNGPLTAEDEQEFHQLQSLANERAAPFVKIHLQTATDLQDELERRPKEPIP